MFTVLVGNKKTCVEDGTPLQEVLEFYGLTDLKTVVCPALPIEERDKSFLSEEQLSKGVRMVEGKTVGQSLVVECVPPAPVRKVFHSCDLVLSIDEKYIDVGITDGSDREERSFLSPLPPLSELAVKDDLRSETALLRKFICEKTTDLLSSCGLSVAKKLVVCTNGFFLKLLLGLPQSYVCDDYPSLCQGQTLWLPAAKIIVLPFADDLVGAQLFCASSKRKEHTFLIDCEKDVTLLYIGKENAVYAYMWDFDYGVICLLALRAALRVLREEDVTPFAYLTGENAYLVEETLADEGLAYAHTEKDLDPLFKACADAGYRSILENEKTRTSFHDLLKDERFQEEMTKLAESFRE